MRFIGCEAEANHACHNAQNEKCQHGVAQSNLSIDSDGVEPGRLNAFQVFKLSAAEKRSDMTSRPSEKRLDPTVPKAVQVLK